MERMKKEGQLTIFVMVAIVVVIAIVGYFIINDVFLEEVSVDSEVSPIYEAVEGCIGDVTEDSINIVGESGGYYELPEKVDDNSIAYYFYEDESLMPSLEVVEREMEKYSEDMLYFCVEKVFLNYPDFELNSGEIDVSVSVKSDDKIYFEVDYPFSVIKENKSYFFNEPLIEIYDVRLFSIFSFISKMMEWQEEEPRGICVNCISDAALELELFIDLWDSSEEDVLFFITDEKSLVNDEPYLFFFTNKYIRGNYDPFVDL